MQQGPQRESRLAELGLGGAADPELDEFARRAHAVLGAENVIVNAIGANQQYLSGLAVEPPPAGHGDPRIVALDRGFCPHLIPRQGKALVLDDVCDYPRFAVNPYLDEAGVRSYIGAGLVDRRTGLVVGSVCAIKTTPHRWGGFEAVNAIHRFADEAWSIITRRGR